MAAPASVRMLVASGPSAPELEVLKKLPPSVEVLKVGGRRCMPRRDMQHAHAWGHECAAAPPPFVRALAACTYSGCARCMRCWFGVWWLVWLYLSPRVSSCMAPLVVYTAIYACTPPLRHHTQTTLNYTRSGWKALGRLCKPV
eukprot:363013-Chlamydomonas_euryale.AAC.5